VAACPENCVRTWIYRNGWRYPGHCRCIHPCATAHCSAPRICELVNNHAQCVCRPNCQMYCTNGFKEVNGCPICECLPGPVVHCGNKICKPGQKCVQVSCIRAPCPPVCM
jgi:hypothetical protein